MGKELKETVIHARVDEEIKSKIKKAAEDRGTTESQFVRWAIEKTLKEIGY